MNLKLTSAELTQEKREEMEGNNNVLDRLFPDVPLFTVCLAVAYPHDEDEAGSLIESVEELEEDSAPIIESIRLHIRASSPSRAMEKAVIAVVQDLDEEDSGPYTIAVVGVFEGALADLANDYQPTDEFLADEAEMQAGDVVDIDT